MHRAGELRSTGAAYTDRQQRRRGGCVRNSVRTAVAVLAIGMRDPERRFCTIVQIQAHRLSICDLNGSYVHDRAYIR